MSGKINCVIVKDLSRFARNYSDAGSLIDNLFVQMGVRCLLYTSALAVVISAILILCMKEREATQTKKKAKKEMCIRDRSDPSSCDGVGGGAGPDPRTYGGGWHP